VPVAPKRPTLACNFYQSETGNEPVRDWLGELPAQVRREVGSDIQRVQWRWPIGKPLVDGFGRGLYEVRTGVDTNIYRVLFCIDDGAMVLLHGFTKKSQKTPAAELEVARKRQREVEKGR